MDNLERRGLGGGSSLVTSQLSNSQILSEINEQIRRLAHEEVRLAKLEVRDEVKTATRGAAVAAFGGALAFAGLIVLLIAATAGLALVLPLWAAALITGAAGLLIGGLLAWGAVHTFKRLGAPRETVETLKEDRAWMNDRMHAIRSRMRANGSISSPMSSPTV